MLNSWWTTKTKTILNYLGNERSMTYFMESKTNVMQVLKMITRRVYVCDDNILCRFTNVIIWNVWVSSKLFAKSCLVGLELHLSFDASSPLGCCLQSHEILLNKCMKYWDSRLNAQGARTFIAIVHKATTMIGWRHLENNSYWLKAFRKRKDNANSI
jgi:hypothetical protein